ncbi:hypothetical protein [Variovorax ginsengisoli]|uniref:Uncharacterized protein n=1 Tax=Variovorax ginsengisoli TaxID=363844 RepID=A0ABT8RZQ6_9BURK|nr:hypothetical protein [Variovorax ginsengisoli]MDN8612760.1 hypothetical protein [Variovorax ginsengisoli]MDO1531930.1 hypothetical protein [Variovorax ginsengisoli]
MSSVIGFLLCLGFAWFAASAFLAGEPIAAAAFVLALLGTLHEMAREPK